MHSLKKDLKASRSSAYAEGTKQNMKIQWESFLMFCIYFGFKYLPANTETLSLYAQFLSRCFKSTQSIKNYLSGVNIMHHLCIGESPSICPFLKNNGPEAPKGPRVHYFSGMDRYEDFLRLKIHHIFYV